MLLLWTGSFLIIPVHLAGRLAIFEVQKMLGTVSRVQLLLLVIAGDVGWDLKGRSTHQGLTGGGSFRL